GQRDPGNEVSATADDPDVPEGGHKRPRIGDGRRGGADGLDSIDSVGRERVGLGAVIAGAAADEVADAVAGEQSIVALLAVEEVVAAAPVQHVVAAAPDEAIGLPGSGQRVVA